MVLGNYGEKKGSVAPVLAYLRWASPLPRHPRDWFRFGTFFLSGYLCLKTDRLAKAVVFYAQGGSREARVRKGAVPGPQMDLSRLMVEAEALRPNKNKSQQNLPKVGLVIRKSAVWHRWRQPPKEQLF